MPILQSQEAIGEHLRAAGAKRDRWLLFAVELLRSIAKGLVVAGRPVAEVFLTKLDYTDVPTRHRFRGHLVSIPRDWLSPEHLVRALSAGGYQVPDASRAVSVLVGGSADDHLGLRFLFDCCDRDLFLSADPGVN